MDALSYSHVRQHLAAVLDQVAEEHCPVLISRQKGRGVVMVAAEDYAALTETAHLLGAPANAARLGAALAELAGSGAADGV